VPTIDVRAALALAETQAHTVGVVYTSDAAYSERVVTLHEVDNSVAPAIRYPAALLNRSTQCPASRDLLRYLSTAPAQAVFASHRFEPLTP
jgi:molybdate transport system substrate-binding protein